MKGISKVIDELGNIIINKDIELNKKQKEIDKLKQKIEMIESYLNIYEDFYKQEQAVVND